MAGYVAFGIAIMFWLLMFYLFGWYAVAVYLAIGVYTVFNTRKLLWYVPTVRNRIGR